MESEGSFGAVLLPFLLRLVWAIVIFYGGKIAAKWLAQRLADRMRKFDLNEMLIKLAQNVAYVAMLLLVALAALEQIGVDTTSALAVFGAAGLAVGLAVKDSLSNFASGVMIAFFEPFNIGHYVDAGGTSGTVVEVGMFNTVLRTIDNKRVIVPNSLVYNDTIVNYSAEENRCILMVFGIGYEDDFAKAVKLINAAIKADKRILKDPEPVVAMAELADSSVNINVRPWVKGSDYWTVRSDLMEKIKVAFDKNGISIPYPQRDIHVYQQGE